MGTVKKVWRYDCLFVTGITREVLILCHLWNLKAGQEVASSAFSYHQGVAPVRVPL
jgi:hypothetical protein